MRDDGQRLFGGALPTLIQWGDAHPAAGMLDAGLSLLDLQLTHPRADPLRQALAVIGLEGPTVAEGPEGLAVRLGSDRARDLWLNHPPVGGRP